MGLSWTSDNTGKQYDGFFIESVLNGRTSANTHGKQKGVKYIIKVL